MSNAAMRIDSPMKNNEKETRIALLEQSLKHSHDIMNRIDKRIDNIDDRFNKIEQLLGSGFEKNNKVIERLEHKIIQLEQRQWTNFYWHLAAMFSLSCAGATILAKGFKWIT